jgi:hypothetical protein
MQISWADREKDEKVLGLRKFQVENRILHTTKRMQGSWIRHTLRMNCLLKHFFEGNTEGERRRGRRHKQLLYDIKDGKGY